MKYTVLIVDDDPFILKGLVRAFRKEPFAVLTASNAGEGFELLQKERIDLVVSDQKMPGISGIDFLEKVSKQYPDKIRFMLTGTASLKLAIDAINKGCVTRFFVKPCNEYELAQSIKDALKHRELITAARKLYLKLVKQDELIKNIEKEHPGIAVLKKDIDGAIILEEGEISQDVIELIRSSREGLPED